MPEDGKNWLERHYESNVRKYFPVCPLCGSKELEIEFNFLEGDFLSCKRCVATWHLYIGVTGLKWAELTFPTRGGYGRHLLNQRLDSKYWKKMCQEKFTTSKAHRVSELIDREILKEAKQEAKLKEVEKVKKRIKDLKEKIDSARDDIDRARDDIDRAQRDKNTDDLETAAEDLERAEEELKRYQEELEREIKKLNSLVRQY
ncbi:MAG: hypothetical protein NC925_03370 [Candidatus Omnitrophica bacterium]|nr:hypothetical protein [Candidatus Omnitrophota bacterium]